MLSRRNFAGLTAMSLAGASAWMSEAFAAAPKDGIFALNPRAPTRIKANYADYSSTLKDAPARGMWIEGWNDPTQRFAWRVNAAKQDSYVATLLINARPGSRIVVETAADRIEMTIPPVADYFGRHWQRVDLPRPLKCPAGISQIVLHAPVISGVTRANDGNFAALLGLELIPVREHARYRREIGASRSDPGWLGTVGYGLMVQWGEWVQPPTGEKKRWPAQIDDFDVEKFVKTAADVGAGYIVWSATWRSHYFPAPIKAIDEILPGRTCKRDLIMDLAKALRARGMRLILYYNCITDDEEWQERIGYRRGGVRVDEPEVVQPRWEKIAREVGMRYGPLLDAWMIDEATYPRDFQSLNAAMKAGHPGRIVSVNGWVRCRLTEFQDFYFGEGVELRKPEDIHQAYAATIDQKTGRFISGPQLGLQTHGNFLLDTQSTLQDWAIWKPNSKITDPLISEADIRLMAKRAVANRHALSFNIMMYEDGTVSQRSLDRLSLMKQCVAEEKAKAGRTA